MDRISLSSPCGRSKRSGAPKVASAKADSASTAPVLPLSTASGSSACASTPAADSATAGASAGGRPAAECAGAEAEEAEGAAARVLAAASSRAVVAGMPLRGGDKHLLTVVFPATVP